MIALHVLTQIFGRLDPVSAHATLINLNSGAECVLEGVNNFKSKHFGCSQRVGASSRFAEKQSKGPL